MKRPVTIDVETSKTIAGWAATVSVNDVPVLTEFYPENVDEDLAAHFVADSFATALRSVVDR